MNRQPDDDMPNPPDDAMTNPLPRSVLPDPQPPTGDPVWRERLDRVMTAARPELERLGSRGAAAAMSRWSALGLWWKPAAVLAAASSALVLLTEPPGTRDEPGGSVALRFVASEGDPVTLWGMLGIEADPVLALIAFRDEAAVSGEAAPRRPPDEENQ